MLEIPGDSINHKKLTLREKRGKVEDMENLKFLLEKATNNELDSEKPIVIIYYPGKDRCNSGGTATEESTKTWFKNLETGVDDIAQTKPIYIYKDSDGLERNKSWLAWHKDPEGVIEKLFFKHHYPCNSFVVISKNSEYISYFGEFGMQHVWEATLLMSD